MIPFLVLLGLGILLAEGVSSASASAPQNPLHPGLPTTGALIAQNGSVWPVLDALAVRSAETGLSGEIPGPLPPGVTMQAVFGNLHRPMLFVKGTILNRYNRGDGGFNYVVSFTEILDGLVPEGVTIPSFSFPQTVTIPYSAVFSGPE